MGEGEKKTPAVAKRAPKHVMLVPKVAFELSFEKTNSDHAESRAFGEQWKDHDSANRTLEEVPVGGSLQDFEDAMKKAAVIAHGKDIALFVGHGGAGGFRGLTETVFDTVPDNGPLSTHKHRITKRTVILDELAVHNGTKWVPKVFTRPNGVKETKIKQTEVDELAPKFEMLERLRPVLQKNGVKRLIVISCNVGKDADFGKALAKRMGIRVSLYTKLIAVAPAEEVVGGKATVRAQIWPMVDQANPSKGRPPHDDPDHPSFHEIPTDFQVSFSP